MDDDRCCLCNVLALGQPQASPGPSEGRNPNPRQGGRGGVISRTALYSYIRSSPRFSPVKARCNDTFSAAPNRPATTGQRSTAALKLLDYEKEKAARLHVGS
jgi:hypothetical protein